MPVFGGRREPMCFPCTAIMTAAAIHAIENGGTYEQASEFAWLFVREERGHRA